MPVVPMAVVRDEPFLGSLGVTRSFRPGSTTLQHADVAGGILSRLVEDPDEIPARRVREFGEVIRRKQEEVEPIADATLVPSAQREESGWAAPCDVPFHVRQVLSNPRPRDPGAADETPTGRGNLPRVSQESSHPRNVPGEAEVVPHEDDRVERPQPSWQPLHAPLVDFLDPADSGECHLAWRCRDP